MSRFASRMSSSREYYHTSGSRSGSYGQAHDRRLPPIRDVVGDELDGRNPYAFNDVRGALPGPAPPFAQSSRGQQRGPTLPPIQQGSHVSRSGTAATGYPRANTPSSSSNRYPSEHSAVMPSQRDGQQFHQPNYTPHPAPSHRHDHAYGVLRTSGTGSSLVHATPPAPRAQGILRQGGAPSQTHDEEPDKRHKCDYCGKKFDRPSSLQVHVRTHTGSQPFTCDWPGCERSFSVRSNMLRHWRSHERTEVSHYALSVHRDGEEEDELFDEDYAAGKSPSTSQGRPSSSGYYSSSSRRR